MEFPRLVYKSASEHTLAEGQDQYDSLTKDDWFGSVPEALAKKHDVVAEDPPAEDPPAEDPPAEDPPAEDPPTRAEMEAQAKTLGIHFTKKTTDADLLQLIADSLDA